MLRSQINKLKETQWVKIEGSDLEVCITPIGAPTIGKLFLNPSDEVVIREICESVFVDFRNYHDDTNGERHAIPNSIDARVELYQIVPIRQAIHEATNNAQREAIEGNVSGGSD